MRTTHAEPVTPRVAVIILNWNGWRATINAIQSVFDQGYENYILIVLDNGSTDQSVERLAEWLQENGAATPAGNPAIIATPSCVLYAKGPKTVFLKNATNDGFAGGINIAVRYALETVDPAWVFLLNNDAIVDSVCLQRCVELACDHGGTIVGAVVKGTDRTTLQFAGADPMREIFLLSPAPRKLEMPDFWETGRAEGSGQLINAAFLRERIAQEGHYLDPRFFMYCEDLDLALRARLLGKKVLMTRSAVIYHSVAGSSGGFGNPLQHYYITRNRIFLARRWLSPMQRILFHAFYPASRVVRILQRFAQGKADVSSAIWQGLIDGYLDRSGKWRRHDYRWDASSQ